MKHLFLCLFFLVSLWSAPFAEAQMAGTRNHFEIYLANGWTQNRAAAEYGTQQPRTALGLNHRLGFLYTRRPSEAWSWSAGWGFGLQGFHYDLPAYQGYSGTEGWSYFQLVTNTSYHRLELGGSHWLALGANHALKLNLNGGIQRFTPASMSISSQYPGLGEEYRFHVEYSGQALPFLSGGPELRWSLPRQNQLALRLDYTHSFRPIYAGDYRLYDGSSGGQLTNSGSMLSLGAGFVFTGAARQERLAALQREQGEIRAARRAYRREARRIDPKALFVTAYGGLGAALTKARDPRGQFMNGWDPEFSARLTVEKGVAKHFFGEAGYHFMEYWATHRFAGSAVSSADWIFTAHQFSLGGGYRLVSRRDYPLLNLHLGLTAGFHAEPPGQDGWGGGTWYTFRDGVQQVLVSYAYESTLSSAFLFSSYLGASKDFRIARGCYLALLYRYQHGWNRLLAREIAYEQPGLPASGQAQLRLDGTEHAFQLGVKVLIR
jgi:hypothetical protein